MNNKDLFNPDEFMQQTVDAPMETKYQLAPEGTFEAQIGEFNSTAFQKIDFEYKKGPKVGEQGSMTKFECPFVTQDPKVLAAMEGRESVTLFMQMIIDRTPEGAIDYGKDKNVRLGKLRAAVNQNAAGAWNFPMLMNSGKLLIKVKHEEYESGGEKKKAARVVDVAPLR